MKIISIKEIKPLIHDSGVIQYYRGESKQFETTLMCGLCRFSDNIEELKIKEKRIFEEFVTEIVNKERAIQKSFTGKYNFEKEWNYLFQGQHLRLHTRLVDWTVDWKIALLFAVNDWSNDNEDGHLWIFDCPKEIKVNINSNNDIYNRSFFDINKSYMINPVQYHPENEEEEIIGRRRMNRQSGRFFIQPLTDSITPLNKQEKFKNALTHLIIDAKSKSKIRKELVEEGCYLSDWIYFKNDCSILDQIKMINDRYIVKNT